MDKSNITIMKIVMGLSCLNWLFVTLIALILMNLVNIQSDRLKQVLEHLGTINSLCLVLGLEFKHTVNEIHPTLDDSSTAKNISSDTIERLSLLIHRLKELKIQRMQKVCQLTIFILILLQNLFLYFFILFL